MKVRQGFVSNSSSSSFVLIALDDYTPNYENEEIKDIYEDAFYVRKAKIDDTTVKIYQGWSSDGENSLTDNSLLNAYCNKNDLDMWDTADKLYDEFADCFDKNKAVYIYTGD